MTYYMHTPLLLTAVSLPGNFLGLIYPLGNLNIESSPEPESSRLADSFF